MAENNQFQSKSVLLDHKMIVEGKTWHEKKELVTTINEEDGREITTFSHSRSIGDRSYQVQQEIISGEKFPLGNITDETVEIGLADFLTEVADFKQDWKDNENPLKSGGSLRSQSGTLEEGSVGHGKSGGSKGSEQKRLRSQSGRFQSGTQKESSVGHGKSGGSKESGQKRSKTNENKEVGHGKSGGSKGSGQKRSKTNEN